MSNRMVSEPRSPGSFQDDKPAAATGRRICLAMVGWAQMGILATLVCALAVYTSEPAHPHGGSPVWAAPTGHPQGIRAMAFAPDGRRLATGGADGVVLWEVGRGVEKELRADPSWAVISITFAPDGATLAVGDLDSAVTLWDVATGQRRAILRGHTGPVRSLAFAPDGRILATGSDDQSIRLWDLGSRDVTTVLLGHRRPVRALGFAPDGRTLASGCAGGLVQLWDVDHDGRGRERPGRRSHSREVWCLAFSPDGSLLASGSVKGRLKLWDVATGLEWAMPDTEDHFTQGVGFSRDGRTLITARATGIIQHRDLAGRRRIAMLESNTESHCAAISGDARFVASGGSDAVVRVWDLDARP